jgi:hypothetical protein
MTEDDPRAHLASGAALGGHRTNPIVVLQTAIYPPTRRRRPAFRLALLAACAVIGVEAGNLLSPPASSTGPSLPATPRQWVDAYEAATVDNPARVCTQLLSPPLAAAYGPLGRSTCETFFGRARGTSVQVRGVLERGPTAIVRLHQTRENANWAVVLQRHATSWWAIDLISGRPPR